MKHANIQGKLNNRGVTCMFVGYAKDHPADTYCFLNLETNRIFTSRDVRWLQLNFKQWVRKGMEGITHLPKIIDEEEDVEKKKNTDTKTGRDNKESSEDFILVAVKSDQEIRNWNRTILQRKCGTDSESVEFHTCQD